MQSLLTMDAVVEVHFMLRVLVSGEKSSAKLTADGTGGAGFIVLVSRGYF